MTSRTIGRGLLLALLAMVVTAGPAWSKTDHGKKGKQDDADTTQRDERSLLRVPNQALDIQKNKVSDVEFYSTNYGIFGLDVRNNKAGGIWPRGSGNAYIFGGGVWFGAQKQRPQGRNSLCVIGYNPNSGASWMVPGTIADGQRKVPLANTPDAWNRYRLYLSSDYNEFSGEPTDPQDSRNRGFGAAWPIWDTDPNAVLKDAGFRGYVGNYIEDVSLRDRATFPKGPAIISQEDLFAVYRDNDVSRYEKLTPKQIDSLGYPIGIQVEQTTYTWGFGRYKDFIFLRYNIINRSGEDLFNCYMAPALDMDIGEAANDKAKIFIEDKAEDTLNLAIQWSDRESKKFGYIGFDFLESPATSPVDTFIRKDKRFYDRNEQIGLSTFQSWTISEDPTSPEQRYSFMASGDRDVAIQAGDKRFLTATGPFNMHPGDTARVVVGICFAYGPGNVPDGSALDTKPLFELDTFMQTVYDLNFLSPKPPAPAQLSWEPINNGVILHWDEKSERSYDPQERGLDFKTYRLRRTRKSINFAGNAATDSTVTGWGLGYKTIATWELPSIPDGVTRVVAARRGDLSLLGPWSRLPMLIDTIPGQSAVRDTFARFAFDTLKRPGLTDTVVRGRYLGTGVNINSTFDPYDDANSDSTLYNDGRFGEQFKNKAIRDIVRDAITSIMDSITGGRTFVDVGDDNGNGEVIEAEDELNTNEKLINNVDYYYALLALDEGSTEDKTAPKINSAVIGLNEVRATPAAPAPGPRVEPQVIGSTNMGGIFNFRLLTLDNQRLGQLFGGDTLDFVFQPLNPLLSYNFYNYFYSNIVSVRSRKQGGAEVFRFALNYDSRFTDRSDPSLGLLDSSFATLRDSVTGQLLQNGRLVRIPYNGSYLADITTPIFNTVGIYKNTFAVAFDYSFLQFGDTLRPGRFGDTSGAFATVTSAGNTNVATGRAVVGQRIPGSTVPGYQNLDTVDRYMHITSFGQPKIEITFEPGGTENITVKKSGQPDRSFDANYLNLKVRNIAAYKRAVVNPNGGVDSVDVQYNYDFTPDAAARARLDSSTTSFPYGRFQPIGTWALFAYAWLNPQNLPYSQRLSNQFNRSKAFAGNIGNEKSAVGTPNRYYTSSYQVDTTRIAFTHKLVVNGAEIYLDYAGMGTIDPKPDTADVPTDDKLPSQDFQAGDKVVVDFTGGALGLPQPGGTVSVAIPNASPSLDALTDSDLDQIGIVPNPYLVTHEGQPANSDRRLYLTRLPDRCTIQIYTESGELLRTIEHDVTAGNPDDPNGGRVAVEVFDLLTQTRRLLASQLLVFRITAPNGAETIKKAAVVVGGYRLLP